MSTNNVTHNISKFNHYDDFVCSSCGIIVKHPKCKFKYCPNCGKKIIDEYKKYNDFMLSAEDLTRYADWNNRSQPEDQCLS